MVLTVFTFSPVDLGDLLELQLLKKTQDYHRPLPLVQQVQRLHQIRVLIDILLTGLRDVFRVSLTGPGAEPRPWPY